MEIEPNVDLAAYLSQNDLLQRQEILSTAAEADIYLRWRGDQLRKRHFGSEDKMIHDVSVEAF